MKQQDIERLARIRAGMEGRTHYEGQEERDDEFLLRLLDETRKGIEAAFEVAAGRQVEWGSRAISSFECLGKVHEKYLYWYNCPEESE